MKHKRWCLKVTEGLSWLTGLLHPHQCCSMCSSTLFSPILRKGLQAYCSVFSSSLPFFSSFSWDLTHAAVNPGLNVAALLCHCMDTDQTEPEGEEGADVLASESPCRRTSAPLAAVGCWSPAKPCLDSGVHGEDCKLHLCHFSLILVLGSAGDGLNLGAASETDHWTACSQPPLRRCCAMQLTTEQPSSLGWDESTGRLCRATQAA